MPLAILSDHRFRSSSTTPKCIADKGCTVCVDVCPLDVLAHQRHDRQGLHGLRRVLVLHAVRGRLPDRRRHRQHSLSAEVSHVEPVRIL